MKSFTKMNECHNQTTSAETWGVGTVDTLHQKRNGVSIKQWDLAICNGVWRCSEKYYTLYSGSHRCLIKRSEQPIVTMAENG